MKIATPMKTILTLFFIAILSQTYAQEYFYVNAENGLSCRAKPDTAGIKIGKLPYGSIVELITITPAKLSVMGNGETIAGNWVKIKYTNFPFTVSTAGNTNYQQEAYVFDGYLEPLNKAKIEIEDLSESQFENYQKTNIQKKNNQTAITDKSEIKKMLKGKVTWVPQEEKEVDYLIMDSLKLNSGQLLKINQLHNDYGLVAYYPEEEVLLFEGGHSSDYAISIKTGEMLTTVGNPEYIITSPNGKMRLNGSFPGQECSDYFFQEVKEGELIYLTNFGWNSVNGDDVCNFKSFIWINDQQFAYSYLDHSTNVQGGVLRYIRGSIIKTVSN